MMNLSNIVYEIGPFEDFILASEVNFDLGGQRSLFEKVLQFNENNAEKVLWRYLDWSTKQNPLKDFILASNVIVDLGGQKSFLYRLL